MAQMTYDTGRTTHIHIILETVFEHQWGKPSQTPHKYTLNCTTLETMFEHQWGKPS